MFRLPGVAFITGAGGTGIGAAVAKGFAHSGCTRFAITDLNAESLEGTRSAIIAIIPDAEVLGRAVLSYRLCAAFDLITNVNYKGSWLVSRAILGHMIKQEPLEENAGQRGSVVNIASQLGVVARPKAAPYCASKAAIINMTRSDAIDYSQDGIRVNCVCPGVIATPMTTASEELVERLRPAINIAPMKRMGTPEEVANAVLFLSSPQASFVQGHALVVDGGYTIN
ncbi:2-(R)-hydroxypropyl-CoM dehydrogenase [Colletotrichum orbiculare MAFF 240422]|uniref:2-(R)-hydroxypropyl-CoM dehydrogenase n=1 Tax=Colletotrichum orbiculare (strain 104-T / ATCC 96160 / CBS 514.97 / LARS 414 / MAFF 240422) TaxID=1213857 RepID=A0A484G2A3_COLOR|nr:2-(R)-hydroxypropyl-CoM dehydrogenase [Colletotrichum orbiculare MAFF 240422]